MWCIVSTIQSHTQCVQPNSAMLIVYLRSPEPPEVAEVLHAMQLCVILTTSCMFAGSDMHS